MNTSTQPPTPVCVHCGTSTPPKSGLFSKNGLCPVCLLSMGTSRNREAPQGPKMEDLTEWFPHLRFLEPLGFGSMGRVFRARDDAQNRDVALKILPQELDAQDPSFAERFLREADALGKLDHPHILRVYASGKAGPFYFLELEFVPGLTLRQAMRQGLTPSEGLLLLPPLCQALQSAHAVGLIHRDIKPENILLDYDGRPKLADFGIARHPAEHAHFSLTMTGSPLGTLYYMAPEQIEKPQSMDHRADIYALGVVAYELVTKELPLGRFPLPSKFENVLCPLDDVILKALEKHPDQRFQNAEEMRRALEKPGLLVNQETIKRRIIRPAGAPRTLKHNFTGLLGFAMSLAVVLVLILISIVVMGVLLPNFLNENSLRNSEQRQAALIFGFLSCCLLLYVQNRWRRSFLPPPKWAILTGLILAWKAGHSALWLRCGVFDPMVLLVIPAMALLCFRSWSQRLGRLVTNVWIVLEALLLAGYYLANSTACEFLRGWVSLPYFGLDYVAWPESQDEVSMFHIHALAFAALAGGLTWAFKTKSISWPTAIDGSLLLQKPNAYLLAVYFFALGLIPEHVTPREVIIHSLRTKPHPNDPNLSVVTLDYSARRGATAEFFVTAATKVTAFVDLATFTHAESKFKPDGQRTVATWHLPLTRDMKKIFDFHLPPSRPVFKHNELYRLGKTKGTANIDLKVFGPKPIWNRDR